MAFVSRGFWALLAVPPKLRCWAALVPLVALGCNHRDVGNGIEVMDGGSRGQGQGGPGVCVVDGERHPEGDSFPASDGCNTCTCEDDGQVACTLRACASLCAGRLRYA